ncbi:MAG: nucleotidyltransferase family protein [Azoarcus sp.]|nr:nucleotidyltransferase family protein [Azoarcus sp.]
MTDGISGILLAAGRGRRFGSDKLLQPLSDGTPMAVVSARSLRAACARCVCVLRPEQRSLGRLLRAEAFEVYFRSEVDLGMGHSLANAVSVSMDASAWVVALGDMPQLATGTVVGVVAALRQGATLAAPTFRGRRGHPVGFSAVWREQLLALRGDEGARALLAENAHLISAFPCDDAGVLLDIDTPDALARIAQRRMQQ